MHTTRKTHQEIHDEAVAALTTYYAAPTPTLGEYLATHTFDQNRYLRAKATTALDAALAEGITMRQLALACHVCGHLLIELASDPAQRRRGYEGEIAYLQRTIRQVEAMRGRDIETRWRAGEPKPALAAEFGVTRPTLDAWMRLGETPRV